MLKDQNEIREKENHRVFKQLLNTFVSSQKNETKAEENQEEYVQNVQIIPKIFYNEFTKQLKIEFKIGDKQLYKIKNLPEFYERMLNKETYKYGNKLNLLHQEESFSENSISILKFLLKYAEIMKYQNEVTNEYTYYSKNFVPDSIIISNTGLDDLFNSLQGKEVLFQKADKEKTIYFSKEEPKISFEINQIENKFKLNCNIDVFSYDILQGKEYIYILFTNAIYRCTAEFKETTLKLLEILRKNYTNEIIMDELELTNFFAIIAPKMENKIKFESLSNSIKEKCIPKKLGVKMYLDYDIHSNITAEVKFCYENQEINPFIKSNENFARNIALENEALNNFIQTGFLLDKAKARLVLADEEKIFSFLSEEIETYMKKYEILATDAFKKKQIHNFQMKSIGIKVENHLLEIDLSQIGIDLSDLNQILQKYRLKKKFHRLKDGSYIQLEENENIQFLEELTYNLDIDYNDFKNGFISMPSYRSLYLEKMLNNLKNVEVKTDKTYKTIVEKLKENQNTTDILIPENLNAQMRLYQKVGYKWLKLLDEYEFGGILADDMGLRKNSSITSCCFIICKRKWKKCKAIFSSMPKLSYIKLVRRMHKIYT